MGYRKFLAFITVALFLAISALPTYGMLIPALNSDTGENRALAQWPGSFDPVGIEAWFDDHFALRGPMTGIYNRFNAKAGVEVLNGVAIGKDSWLYYMYDNSDIDIKRESHYTDEELANICYAQQATKDYLEGQGIEYYLMVCPDKHTVYPEYLPDGLSGYEGESRFDGMARAINENTDVTLIDTRQSVIDGKGDQRLFFKTDTHWNAYGAYIGYVQLMETIAVDFPNVRIVGLDEVDVVITDPWTGGDMSGFIGQSETMTDILYNFNVKDSTVVLLETPYAETSEDPTRPVLRYTNPDHPELPSAVIFRDSFVGRDASCTLMIPLLADSFSSVTIVWSTSVLNHIVEYEQPDIVVMEYVERYSGSAVQGMNIPEVKIVDYESGELPLPRETFSIQHNVDHMDNDKNLDVGTIVGWAFMPKRDAVQGEKHIALKCGDDIVWCTTSTVYRPDVTAAYADITGGLNLDYSGFSASYDKSKLYPGKWDVVLVIDDGQGDPVYIELGKRIRISEPDSGAAEEVDAAESEPFVLPGKRDDIEYYVDSMDDASIVGWAYMSGKDAVFGEKTIALMCGDDIVLCDTDTENRPDVTAAFEAGNGGLNLDNAGFRAAYDTSMLHPGTWQFIVVFDDGLGNNGYIELGKSISISE